MNIRNAVQKVGIGASGLLVSGLAMATTTFEDAVFDALTTKVGLVVTEAGPYVALVLGVYLVYKMVKRFT